MRELRQFWEQLLIKCLQGAVFMGPCRVLLTDTKSYSTLASLSLVLLLCSHFSEHCLNRFGCDKMMKHSAILLYTHRPQYFQAAVPVIVEWLIF